MVLAHKTFDAIDEHGNLLTDVEVRVQIEGAGLASLFSDRAGSTPIGNPVTFADGKVDFYAAGGAHKITLTKGLFTRELRYQGMGTAGEFDAGAFALAANTYTKSEVDDLVGGGSRERLAADRTYYVRPDGSDANDGLANTSGGAFLTIQKAVNVAYGLDLNGFNVTIQVADGTYTAGAALNGPWVGKGTVVIQGNVTTPANVVVNATSANAFQVVNYAIVTIKGFKVTTTTAGSAIYSNTGGSISFDKMDFGACAGPQIVGDGGKVSGILLGSNTISGGAVSFAHSFNDGEVTIGYNTITVTGTPAFSAYFVGVAAAHMNFEGTTFSGAATGQRFVVHKDGYINTNHQGLNFFPGSSAGAIYPGGQYDYFTENPPRTVTANFSVNPEDVFIINNKSGSSCTATLLDPTAAASPKKLYVKNTQAQTLVSASSNVTPKAGGAAGTAILPATAGAWALLVADGSTWVIMQSGT